MRTACSDTNFLASCSCATSPTSRIVELHSLPHAPVAPAESSIPSEPQPANPLAPEGTRQKEQTPLPTTETFSSAEDVRR